MAWSLDTLVLMCLRGLGICDIFFIGMMYNHQLHLALLAVGGYEVLTAGSGSINSEGNEVILKSTTGSTGSMGCVALTAAHDFSKSPSDSLVSNTTDRHSNSTPFDSLPPDSKIIRKEDVRCEILLLAH